MVKTGTEVGVVGVAGWAAPGPCWTRPLSRVAGCVTEASARAFWRCVLPETSPNLKAFGVGELLFDGRAAVSERSTLPVSLNWYVIVHAGFGLGEHPLNEDSML